MGIFWIYSDQCGHSEWNIAISSIGGYLSRNHLGRAESLSDRSEKGKYWSLKCWNLEYYHPSEVHPQTSAISMHTKFEQAPSWCTWLQLHHLAELQLVEQWLSLASATRRMPYWLPKHLVQHNPLHLELDTSSCTISQTHGREHHWIRRTGSQKYLTAPPPIGNAATIHQCLYYLLPYL